METNKFTKESIYEDLINEETGEHYQQLDVDYLMYKGKKIYEGFGIWIIAQNDDLCYINDDMGSTYCVVDRNGKATYNHSSFFENPDLDLEWSKEDIEEIANKQKEFANCLKQLGIE